MDIRAFLDARRTSDHEWTFAFPVELNGAFGGTFGGIIAAGAVLVSRDEAPGRAPVALDCRFLRGLAPGTARYRTSVLHSGRTLSCVVVDVFDARERLATRATVSLVEAGALRDVQRASLTPPVGWQSFDDARPWAPVAPIVETLQARALATGPDGIASAVRVPWEGGPSAEAACLAADASVGPPVAVAVAGESVSTPNPDLSVRFCGEVSTEHVVGLARAERAAGGVAVVRMSIWSGDELVGVGVSSTLLLGL